jgi:mycothiol synthase
MGDARDGFSLRAATAGDRPAVCDVIAAANDHDGLPMVVTIEEVEQDLDDERVVLATDARVAVDAAGAVVGYAFTFHLPSEECEERCYIFGDVHPAWRRRGVGSALLTWGIERASQQLGASTHELPRYIRVDAYDYCEADHRLFARHGFTPVRYFEELLRPLSDLPPEPASGAIPGLRIIPWPVDRSEEIRAEKNAAFADHWGSTPTSIENWIEMTSGHGSFVEHSFVCVDDHDRIVAHCLNARYPEDDVLLGRKDGWIESLGTLREWRGRGVASALIAMSLHQFARAGLSHASIGVDGDSPTGAARLYRALGFETRQRSITRQLEVAASGSGQVRM